MTTPTGPRDHDPIDGPVRNHLWRVRARLVTPPHEDRVQADLDRIVTAARRRAHAGPSADASAQPGPFAGDATPDRPLVGAPVDGVARLPSADDAAQPTVVAAGDDLDRARARRRPAARFTAQVVGRAAAAALLVVSVGAGVAVARDGTVSLDALLGREPIQPRVDDAGGLAGPDVDEPDLPVDDPGGAALEVPDEPPDTATSDPEREDEGSGDGDADGAESDAAGQDTADHDAGQADGAEQQGSGDGSSGSPGSSGGSSDSSGSSGSSDGDSSQDQASDDGSDDADEGSGENEVVAAPEEDDQLDGFGGRSDCDSDDVEDCLDDADEQEGDDADDDDDLAERRYRPDDGDDD